MAASARLMLALARVTVATVTLATVTLATLTLATVTLATVTVAGRERRPGQPRLEGRLISPPGHDQPGGPAVGGPQQLKAFEAVLIIDRPGARGEPPG